MEVINGTIRHTTIIEYSEAPHRLVIIKNCGSNHIYDRKKETTLCGMYIFWQSIHHTKQETTCTRCSHLLNKELKSVI
jgi:hypothetical protein